MRKVKKIVKKNKVKIKLNQNTPQINTYNTNPTQAQLTYPSVGYYRENDIR